MAKLKKKTVKHYKGKVFDLTVEESHSYNIEGLGVHNSAAGSLLSWCLDITKIDPVRFNLYFERFLNPERNSPPDIDIDFLADTDNYVNDFLYKKYGKERILPVATFQTFNERNCIKDVVRAHGGNAGFDSEVHKVTKEMPVSFSKEGYTLESWFKEWPKNPGCSQEVRNFLLNPENSEILEQACKLQGQIRGVGQHAAGVVITPGPSWDYLPANIIASNQTLVTAFQEADKSGKDLSSLGILKLDRLKLTTLNVIIDAIELVKNNHNIDIKNKIFDVDITDKNLYHELRLGFNHGVFQFESPGMNTLIKGVTVENFDELVAVAALYRPGPMGIGAHEEFIKNKFNPDKITYVHPSLKSILSETNGVLCFQEQVMFIADKIGGMGLGEGDLLRRYMDKADKLISKEVEGQVLTPEELNDKSYKNFQIYWNKFLSGAEKNGYNKEEIDQIKGWMIKYLGYSFNKCLTKNHKVISKNRGEINILDVKKGEKILGYNSDKHVNEYVPVKDIHNNGFKKVYKIKTKSGKTLECTENHKIMTEYGMKTLREIMDNRFKIKISDF